MNDETEYQESAAAYGCALAMLFIGAVFAGIGLLTVLSWFWR